MSRKSPIELKRYTARSMLKTLKKLDETSLEKKLQHMVKIHILKLAEAIDERDNKMWDRQHPGEQ